jgi:hypothetical protein
MSEVGDALQAVVVPFADEIGDLLRNVFGTIVEIDVTPLRGRFHVRNPDPLRLAIKGEGLGGLHIDFWCTWDSAGTFLAVDKSTIKLSALLDRNPIFRFEYQRQAHRTPSAHIQVHGHRGALSHLLSRAGHENPHSMEALHLPVGGARFRPCIEDVLQFLIDDCLFDAQPGWREYVERGRERWRRMQLRAAVRDVPGEAADVLRRLGYTVLEPADSLPGRSSYTLRAW